MNCPICGAVLNEGAKFCGNCGNKLATVQPAAQPAAETPVQPMVTPIVETPVQPVVTPVAETPVQPMVTPVVETPVQPVVTPVAETPVQPVVTPVAETPVQPMVTPVPETPVQPMVTPVPETPIQPAAPAEPVSIFDQPAPTAVVPPVQPDQQIYAQPQPAAGQGGYGGNNYIQNNYTQENINAPQVKKKGKGILVAVLIVLVLLIVCAGVTLFIFRGSLKNMWARMTKSPDEYLKYVISENMEESLDAMEDAQNEYMDVLAKMDDINMKGSLRLEMDDDVLDMLEDTAASYLSRRMGSSSYTAPDYYDYYDDYYDTDMYDKYDTYDDYYQAEHASKSSGGNGMNMSAYGDISVSGEYDRKGNLLGLTAGIQVKGGSDVIGVDGVFDGDNYTVYGRIPQLNSDYVMIDLSQVLDKTQLKEVDKVLSATADFSAATMDAKTVRNMYSRYVTAILDPIKDVKASKVKLSVNGSKLSCRAYEFEMDDDMFQDSVLSVIDEIKNDKDLGKWFDDYMDSMDFANSASKPDWDTFLDQLEDAEKDVKNIKFDEEFKCAFYITNDGKITGFSMQGEDEKDPHFSFVWNLNGTKLDVELTSDYTDKNDKVQFMDIKGGGSVKGGKFSGDFILDLSALDDKVEFSLEDVEISDKKNPGGTFRIGIEQFMNMAGDVVDDVPDSIKKAEFVVSVSGTLKDKTFSIGLENAGKNIIKLTSNGKIAESQGVSVPSSKESVEIDEKNYDTAMIQYLKDSDLEKVVSGLETLGLPDTYADQIRQVTKMLEYY